MLTIASLVWGILEFRDIHRGPDSSGAEIDRQIKDLEARHGFNAAQSIPFLEGHLNALDAKNQSMLGFGVNYIVLVGTIYFLMFNLNTMGSNMFVIPLICLVLVSVGMLLSFVAVNRVNWQDYTSENIEVCRDLLKARHDRTAAFRISKVFYIVSLGWLGDTTALLVLDRLHIIRL